MYSNKIPEKVRVSIGTAIFLGLIRGKIDAPPTTAYLMTYKNGKCLANCKFCPQARESHGRADMLSRVMWPSFSTVDVIKSIKRAFENGKIKRVCIQAINYPEIFSDIKKLVEIVLEEVKIPISVSCQPLSSEDIETLAEAGIDRVGIPLDAATAEIFDKVKGAKAGGPYDINRQLNMLKKAVEIFGRNRVSTHLIVGLGETERDMVNMLQKCVNMGVLPALFAFTPVKGTAMEKVSPPLISTYRRIQLARYIIVNNVGRFEDMKFDGEGRIIEFGVDPQTLREIINSGKPFQTSGCPACNRPYYNERPSGPIYNYPRPLTGEEILKIFGELGMSPSG
ncbi:MAG: radical SAM protein [Candidatus Bathyarchaeia archaeon]